PAVGHRIQQPGLDRLFFFSSRRRHTRCLSDWSSDVCSSDLEFIATISKRGYRFVAPVEEITKQKAPARKGKIMLAVLPFENLSGDRKSACRERASRWGGAEWRRADGTSGARGRWRHDYTRRR